MARSTRQLRLIEFVLWVVTVSAVVITSSLAVGLVVGGDLLTGKYILFVVGFLIFGIGSFLIQPSRPRRDHAEATQTNQEPAEGLRFDPNSGGHQYGTVLGSGPDLDTLRHRLRARATHQHRFEAKIQEVGPLADHHLPFDQRIGREYKIFATSFVVLAFSLAMEVVGIHI